MGMVHAQKRNCLCCNVVMGYAFVGVLVDCSSDVSMRRQLVQHAELHHTPSFDAELEPFLGDVELPSTLRPVHITMVTEVDFAPFGQTSRYS